MDYSNLLDELATIERVYFTEGRNNNYILDNQ